MKFRVYFMVSVLFLLFTGCVNNQNITYLNENYKEKITESSLILTQDSTFKMKVIKNSRYDQRKLCKGASNTVISNLNDKIGLIPEFTSRNIEFISFGKKSKTLFVVSPKEYFSAISSTCSPTTMKFEVRLIDTEDLTKNWKGKASAEKIKAMNKAYANNIIWQKTFSWNFRENPMSENENVNPLIHDLVIKELEKTDLLPKRIMSFDEAINATAKRMKANGEKAKLKKAIANKSTTLNTLSYLGCSKIEDRLNFGYSAKSKAMCLGNLSFVNVNKNRSKQTLSMLNATTSKSTFTLENSSCKNLVISKASGSKYDDNVDFKSTFKEQLLKHYKNKCLVDNIDGINFLTCGTKEKDYFLELSFTNNQRVYKKYMVQSEKMCFDRFKKYFNKENLDPAWRTKYGYNKNGFNYLGQNIFTDSKYDLTGYDYKNWDKNGINKITKTKYATDGFDINGVHKDGVDKNGWSSKLKKFVKTNTELNPYSFKVLSLDTQMKNKFYNRSFYNKVSYEKTKSGFMLVGTKIYGEKTKPTKIEKYYYRSAKSKTLDLDNPKKAILKDRLVLDKKTTRVFDKNGIDKDGFDRHDWNNKLKKFRSQIASK